MLPCAVAPPSAEATPSTTGGSTVTSGPQVVGGPSGIDGAVHFTSQQSMNKQQLSSSSSLTKAASAIGYNASLSSLSQLQQSNPAVAAARLNQFKLECGRIARRELMELDAIERAFRDDMNVHGKGWSMLRQWLLSKYFEGGEIVNQEAIGTAREEV